MNENLRRALLRARLNEEDVAAQLQVDPKTVRRWLEGRVPYLRHRWTLANLLEADEPDLWPQTPAAIAARSKPAEIMAVYPNRQAMPHQTWRSLFRSAEHEIGILDHDGLFLTQEPGVLDVLSDRGHAGVRVRICLPNPNVHFRAENATGEDPGDTVCDENLEDLAPFPRLRQIGAEIRLHRTVLYSTLYRSDNQILVAQHLYGIASEREPVIHLRSAAAGDMAATYLNVFERIWATSLPAA
jgi:transcriptional regulator with XRE-family HTH domain